MKKNLNLELIFRKYFETLLKIIILKEGFY